jgi:TM2 domain-containing membrane protein YozV
VTRSSPPTTNDQEPLFLTLLALGLGLVIPGAGHISIGQRGRGLVFGITITALFFAGLLIGGVQSVGPQDQPIWRYTQVLAVGPYMVGRFLANTYPPPEHPLDFFPKLRDVGSVYCGIAGMLNLLVLFDASIRIAGHRKPGPGDDDAATGGHK